MHVPEISAVRSTRLTLASRTPGTARKACSTADTQLAQLMPEIEKRIGAGWSMAIASVANRARHG